MFHHTNPIFLIHNIFPIVSLFMGATQSLVSFVKPVEKTTEPDHIIEGVENLKKRGCCSICIRRLMSLDIARSKNLCPTTNNENSCECCRGISSNIEKIKMIVKEKGRKTYRQNHQNRRGVRALFRHARFLQQRHGYHSAAPAEYTVRYTHRPAAGNPLYV